MFSVEHFVFPIQKFKLSFFEVITSEKPLIHLWTWNLGNHSIGTCNPKSVFSLVKRTRLLQWLVFFRQTIHSSRMYHFLWIIHFYQKYSVLDFERIQRPLPWNAKSRRVPLPIFRRYETFPAPFLALWEFFSNFFKVFKGSPFYFLVFCNWMDVEKA